MKLKQHRKHRKFVSSAVSLLLIFTMILSFSVYVFAETPDFTGTIPTEAEKNSLQENREYIPSEKEEMTLSEKGLPIIFEGGIHYIEDPAYPGEKITLFCMNNERHWPHHTEDMGDVQVPEYTEGYLTPGKFDSEADYKECMRRLSKLLYAGYPYNGERLYKIVDNSELHTPTESQFNEMLIPTPVLQTAFPYLGHHSFTYKDWETNDTEHLDELRRFMNAVAKLYPEGNGYRLKTRFARFYNLPELMQMFREVADIQTADMLNLPVPEAEYRVVKVKPTKLQEEMVEELGNRAERVRNNEVNPREDNMLKITNDGRKLALDQRLSNPLLPDDPGSKVNACVEEIYRHWEDGKEKKLTQLVFCDLSTPKTDGTFSVYNDIRDKLLARGIPPEEIAFIHDANTDVRKKELFSKVRRGAVRILMGSTFKMGAGTNVQDRIIASHDLDCPWRPRDLEQRAGRTIRQGNQNPKVEIIRYVTEGTFDAYLYQTIENKQKYISQIMTSKSPARSVEDIDEVALSYAEIKALATGNPHIKEKMDLDIQVSRLQLLKQSFLNQKYEMEDKVAKYFPEKIRQQELLIRQYEEDIQKVKAHTPTDREAFPVMQIGDHVYTEKKEAGQAIIEACKAMKSPEPVPLGTYRGLSMELSYSSVSQEFVIALHGKGTYKVPLGTDIYGNITRLDNKMNELPDNLSRSREQLETAKSQLETAKAEAQKEFPQEKELAEKVARLGELNVLLDMDKKDRVVMEEEPETEEIEPEREKAAWVR